MAESSSQPVAPPSNATVQFSVIDCGNAVSNIKPTVFMEPFIPQHPVLEKTPSYSFLIEHQSGNYLFDLGIRKDVENLPSVHRAMLQHLQWTLETPSDVAGSLASGGVDLASVKAIIWSHSHFDHHGDPNTFPDSTDLIVGPGFKANFVPSYPTKPDGGVDENAWRSRNLIEVDFNAPNSTSIAGLRALDFFGDGSFYLLDAPGHDIGHMMGLARTTPDSFILMGADACHHPGHFRPSTVAPVPTPFPCPAEVLTKAHPHPERATVQPFYEYPDVEDGKGMARNRKDAMETRDALMRLDARANVLTVIAHDATVLRSDKFKVFPTRANKWQEEKWKDDVMWRFLDDFA